MAMEWPAGKSMASIGISGTQPPINSAPEFAYDASSTEGYGLRKVFNGGRGFRRAHETQTKTSGRRMYELESLVRYQNERNLRRCARIHYVHYSYRSNR